MSGGGRVFAADEDALRLIKREARAAARLNHLNIVDIYDWGRDQGVYFMVMELIPGRNLREVLREQLGGTYSVSVGGGIQARWGAGGREVFYRTGNPMVAVTFDGYPMAKAGRPGPKRWKSLSSP